VEIMKKTIQVRGMTCHSCETIIKEEVEELEGVKTCAVSHKKGEAVVEYDEAQIALEKIEKTIQKEGYETE
jgi:mercuric ion transport protein